jgi:transcriptional regulator with XRE-family HTH domain
MNERQKRLKEVYEYLRKSYGIHTQSDFANALRKSRNSITLALNGDGKYLTDKLFKNICEAFKGVFDLNYLLTGEGSLLTIEEEVHNEDYERLCNPQPIDNSSLVNAIIAAKDETIASLRRELDAKNETIALQRSRIAELERQIAESTQSDLSRYPFTIGTAEDSKRTKTR